MDTTDYANNGGLKRARVDIHGETPGIFKVSRPSSGGYDTYNSFVGVFKSPGDARRCHPGGGDACQYTEDELERNESWLESTPSSNGPAPPWYRGQYDTWIHGDYAEVKLISYYIVPEGEEPKYGIILTDFTSG
jgi:hypothetical protein